MEQLTEELRRELDILILRKDTALRRMEFESLREKATTCLRQQLCKLLSLLSSVDAGKLDSSTDRLKAWRDETSVLVSENVHPCEGERFREVLKLTSNVDNRVANFVDEVKMYLDFLGPLEKQLTEKSTSLDELLQDRLRLGHIVQNRIPLLSRNFLKVSNATLEGLLEDIKHAFIKTPPMPPGLSLEARTFDTFLSWLSEMDEIIENLNISLTDLFSLGKQSTLSGDELWQRYRYSVRMYIYEYGRIRSGFRRFLKGLWRLKHIDQATRLSLEECWSMLTYQMRDVRNQIYHALMPAIEDEKRAYITALIAPTVSSIVVDKKSGQPIQARDEIVLVAEKLASEFYKSDRNAIAVLQVLTEEQYQIIIERYPDWQTQ